MAGFYRRNAGRIQRPPRLQSIIRYTASTVPPTDPPPGDPPSVHPLDYAPRPPRGPHWLRRLTLWMLFAAVVLSCLAFGRQALQQATVLYWQRQCLNYPNAGQPVSFALSAAGQPAAWAKFQSACGAPAGQPSSYCLYLGRMKRPDGAQRLVYVYFCNVYNGPPKTFVAIAYNVIDPATLTRPAQSLADNLAGDFVLGVATPQNSPAAHGAVLDPADPSHFTVKIDLIYGQTSILDGFLDNNDKLQLEQRPGS